MIPIKNKNIIVGVKNKNKFKWYISPKVIWAFDLSTLNPGEHIKYAKDIIEYRPDLEVIDNINFNVLLANIADLRVDTRDLRNDLNDLLLYDENFIEDYLPSIFVDFDKKMYYAHNSNVDYYKRSISKDFTFVDEDFLHLIDPIYYYWQK